MKVLLLVCLLGAALADHHHKCNNIMSKAGISDNFAKHVSHAIHSLTVEDLQEYFNKDAGVNNNIPVVNPRLRDEPRVLENAPMMNYDPEFATSGMKHFDIIMKGINMDGWRLSSFGLLERLSHIFHMSEIWAEAGKKYKRVKRRINVDSDLCECVRDTESNGLAKYLQLTAFQIRYPGITSGNTEITDSYLGGFLDYHISYGLEERPDNIVKSLMDFDFSGTDEELIADVIGQLVDHAAVEEEHDEEYEMAHSREHWDWCVGKLKELMTHELVYDTAVFMHCQLNLE